MGIISVEHMERLYWLGRYTERTYTTTRIFEHSYDKMIDFQPETYHRFCDRLDIPDIYPDKETFIEQYCFDEKDQNSIYSNLMRAYDNAVVMREQIGSEPLSYLQLAMYDMNRARTSEAPIMDLMRVELQGKRRICIVTGIHGDELEGQYVCYELARRIESELQSFDGIVDIYPALNPFGIDSVTRGIPAFDLDMNRIFPGNVDGDMNEYVAAKIIEDLKGADLCIDIHASNIYLTEIPQIRINKLHKDRLLPYAKKSNVDFVWIHENNTVLASALAYSLNEQNVPTLVVEMGVGMRITKEYGEQLVTGIFQLMRELGIWKGEVSPVRTPVVSEEPEDVCFLNAPVSGVFLKKCMHGSHVEQGDVIGSIIDPLKGVVLEQVVAPEKGWLFTIREYPMVGEGALLGRILKEE